jgi:TetR/AcrR family transcriptional regulator, transcriptional repressor of aconitase
VPKVSKGYLDRRRAEILEAASECFARNGFHRTTMQDVVKESRLSPGAIYNYFDSKEEIIEAIADERHAREHAAIGEALAQKRLADATAQLRAAFFSPLSEPRRRRQLRMGVQLWAEALRNPRILNIIRRGFAEPHGLLTKLIERAQRRGEIAKKFDAGAFARIMIAVFQGFVLQLAWDPRTPIEPYVEALEQLFQVLEVSAFSGNRVAKRRS